MRLALALILMLSPPTAAADPLATALDAIRNGRTAEAVAIYRDMALAGDGRAQFNLGLLYFDGRGLPQNHAEALYWAWRARLSGVAAAPALLARLAPVASADLRETLAARITADLQPRIDAGQARAMLERAAVHLEIAPEPDPAQAFVWQALAAALDEPGAAVARDATGALLDPETRLEAEAQAQDTLADLCRTGLQGAMVCVAAGLASGVAPNG